MPNTASAKKRLRQSLVRRARNRATKSALKSVARKVRDAIAAGDLAAAETHFRLAVKKFDQAAAKNVIHANAAARVKSRMSAAIKRAKQQPA